MQLTPIYNSMTAPGTATACRISPCLRSLRYWRRSSKGQVTWTWSASTPRGRSVVALPTLSTPSAGTRPTSTGVCSIATVRPSKPTMPARTGTAMPLPCACVRHANSWNTWVGLSRPSPLVSTAPTWPRRQSMRSWPCSAGAVSPLSHWPPRTVHCNACTPAMRGSIQWSALPSKSAAR
ncbi:hypothetical protein D3C72_1202260 [compost metagenome]